MILIFRQLIILKLIFLIAISFFLCLLPADNDPLISNYFALYKLGKEFLFKNDYQGAIRKFKKAVRLNPKEIKVYTSLGMSYFKAGDRENARKYWLEGYNLDPRNSELFGILEMTKALPREKESETESWENYFKEGNRKYKENKFSEAVLDLEKAIKLNPKHALSYFTLGAAYRKTGNFEKAIENWEAFLKMKPDDKLTLELLERIKIKMKDDQNRGRTDPELQKELESMVLIPSGEFIRGSDRELAIKRNYEAGVDEFPQHKVFVPSFYIDKYEMTNFRYKKFIDATKRRAPHNDKHPDDPYIWRNNTYRQGEENYPVTLVNWYDANAYCQWKGKRLPTEAEWEKAARGAEGNFWPWGNEESLLRANTGDLKTDQLMYVGNFDKGVSPYGVYNMSGNAEEWTDSWYVRYPGSDLKRDNFGEKEKVVKGGSYLKPFKMFARSAMRFSTDPNYGHRSISFRCAKGV